MFGLGFGELLLVFLIALIFIGPKKLPELAKGLGQGIKEFQKAAKGLSDQIEESSKSETTKSIVDAQHTTTKEVKSEDASNKEHHS